MGRQVRMKAVVVLVWRRRCCHQPQDDVDWKWCVAETSLSLSHEVIADILALRYALLRLMWIFILRVTEKVPSFKNIHILQEAHQKHQGYWRLYRSVVRNGSLRWSHRMTGASICSGETGGGMLAMSIALRAATRVKMAATVTANKQTSILTWQGGTEMWDNILMMTASHEDTAMAVIVLHPCCPISIKSLFLPE